MPAFTSGIFAVPSPSPSLDPAALGEVDPKDKTRVAGQACLAHAAIVAGEACTIARSMHAHPTLSVVDRHRSAHESATTAILPWLDTLEKTQATYKKEIDSLHKLLDVPGGEFSELQLAEARSKLSGMAPNQRYAAIKKSIERGSDLLVAVITKSDEFLVGDLISDGERADMLSRWRAARLPDQNARLVVLETDFAVVDGSGKIMDGYLRSVANPSIVAGGDLPPTPHVRGTGPAPTNRSMASGINSLNPAERAKATSRMIAAQQGR
jgi:hypothetical protein